MIWVYIWNTLPPSPATSNSWSSPINSFSKISSLTSPVGLLLGGPSGYWYLERSLPIWERFWPPFSTLSSCFFYHKPLACLYRSYDHTSWPLRCCLVGRPSWLESRSFPLWAPSLTHGRFRVNWEVDGQIISEISYMDILETSRGLLVMYNHHKLSTVSKSSSEPRFYKKRRSMS